jgi:hypothetical protein
MEKITMQKNKNPRWKNRKIRVFRDSRHGPEAAQMPLDSTGNSDGTLGVLIRSMKWQLNRRTIYLYPRVFSSSDLVFNDDFSGITLDKDWHTYIMSNAAEGPPGTATVPAAATKVDLTSPITTLPAMSRSTTA